MPPQVFCVTTNTWRKAELTFNSCVRRMTLQPWQKPLSKTRTNSSSAGKQRQCETTFGSSSHHSQATGVGGTNELTTWRSTGPYFAKSVARDCAVSVYNLLYLQQCAAQYSARNHLHDVLGTRDRHFADQDGA